MDLERSKSKPQSLVRSHQYEYKELINAASNLHMEIGFVAIASLEKGDTPKTEELMLPLPWFVANLVASLNDALGCGKVNDGE